MGKISERSKRMFKKGNLRFVHQTVALVRKAEMAQSSNFKVELLATCLIPRKLERPKAVLLLHRRTEEFSLLQLQFRESEPVLFTESDIRSFSSSQGVYPQV
ncbi:hypothetical protein POX_e06916 [Penicillium oxalicum]|uniref:Uncharacterized protein n=1 Tax=Penicillium oxalicum (strain 114-2 / CGMCC 5302) TaxID=933388 RepID=S7ZH10_PENO1|nr:hypothetical protein POX_e06916 [Penicillium oxalicum]EPS27941.1 hypothetical protein PDE_02885 [Penicillium oxalicum 114-2]KAI2788892.1 hypothetical protein POX_e06916 [Penicillium oxalicum]